MSKLPKTVNRLTSIKIVAAGKVIKKIPYVEVSYQSSHILIQLKKQLEMSLQLAPDDDPYEILRVFTRNGEEEDELTEDNMKAFKESVFAKETGSKVHLTVSSSIKHALLVSAVFNLFTEMR